MPSQLGCRVNLKYFLTNGDEEWAISERIGGKKEVICFKSKDKHNLAMIERVDVDRFVVLENDVSQLFATSLLGVAWVGVEMIV